jgi:ATP-independent RNA helicase DbpA
MSEIPSFIGVEDAFEINYLGTKENKPQLTLKAVRAFENDKLDALFGLICMLGSSTSLVFCNHREAVDRDKGLAGKEWHCSRYVHGVWSKKTVKGL